MHSGWIAQQDFRVFADLLPSPIVISIARGNVVFVNQRFTQLTGVSAADMAGDASLCLIHPDDQEAFHATRHAAHATGEPYNLEYRLRAHDGEFHWIQANAVAMRTDGRITHWVAILSDINDRKLGEIADARARSALFAINEQRLRRVIDSGIVGIGFGSQTGGVHYVNDAFLNMIGRTRAELEAGEINWRALTAPEYHAFDDAAFAEMLAEGICRPYEKEYDLPAGRLPVQITMALLDPRDPDGDHVAVIVDISGQKRAEAALQERTRLLRRASTRLLSETRRREAAQLALLQSQRLEALGQFTSGIAHDFNNLIAAVGGAFRVIERRTDDSRILDVARHGADAAWRGAAMVRRLLTFASAQAAAPRPVHLDLLMPEVEPLIRQTLGARMSLDIDMPPGLWPVLADPIQLEAALVNLAANARDAASEGGTLSITLRALPAGADRPSEMASGDCLAIAVSDNGAGMTPDVLQRVVEPFFTTKGPSKGTGLGLAMVHDFVRQSGGALRIASRVGVGTTITLYLPRATTEAPQDEHPAPAAPPPPASRPGATVLIVEDDAAMRGVLSAMLSDLGFGVIQAASGADALLIVARPGQAIDIVLCDVMMPRTDGLAFVALMRQDHPALPVLFMTGHADLERLKGEAVIQKPFEAPELATRLSIMLEPHAASGGHADEGLDRLASRLRARGLKALLRRWRMARGTGALPALAQFDIAADGHRDRIAVIEVDCRVVPVAFRIADIGEALRDAAGHPPSDSDFASPGEDVLGSRETAYRRCVRSARPIYEHARFTFDDDRPVLFERLLLPFADDEGTVSHLVSAVVLDGLDDTQPPARAISP